MSPVANACLGPRCKYEYCWLCLANYGEIINLGNEAHEKTCRYHSSNLTPENDYEINGEDEYDTEECEDYDENEEESADDEPAIRTGLLPPSAVNGGEDASPATNVTSPETLLYQARALDIRMARYNPVATQGANVVRLPLPWQDVTMPRARRPLPLPNVALRQARGQIATEGTMESMPQGANLLRLPHRIPDIPLRRARAQTVTDGPPRSIPQEQPTDVVSVMRDLGRRAVGRSQQP